MPQVEVNIQTDGGVSAQTDSSSGGKYSDRWGDNAQTDAASARR